MRSSEWRRGWFKECGNPQPSGPRAHMEGKLSIYIVLNSVSLPCGVLVACTILCACADGYPVNHSQLTYLSTPLFYNISPKFHFLPCIFIFISAVCDFEWYRLWPNFQCPEPVVVIVEFSPQRYYFESNFYLCWTLITAVQFKFDLAYDDISGTKLKCFRHRICVVDFDFSSFFLIELNNNILICSTVLQLLKL